MNDKTARHWDSASAAAWDKWFHVFEQGAQALSDRMVEMAGIAPGHRVLDVATGLGEPAVTAARRTGPTGSVLAIDLSADMLAFGRRRAASLGLDNIEFREMDGQKMALPEGAIDAVLCRWGLMFVRDLEVTLAGIRRCLVPGGRLVAAVWGPAERVPGVGLSARVVRRHLDMAPPGEGPLTPFAFSDPDGLLRALEAGGFSEVQGEWVTVEFAFESPEAFTQFRYDRSGPLRREIADAPDDRQEAAWRAVTEAARAYQTAEGTVRMNNEAYCVVGRR